MEKYIESKISENNIWKGMFHLEHSEKNDAKLVLLLNRFPAYCISKEGGSAEGESKPHYHFFAILDASTCQLDTFKKDIRKDFPELKRPVNPDKKPGEKQSGGNHLYSVGPPKILNKKQYKNYLSTAEQLLLEVCYIGKEVTDANPPILKNFKLYQIKNLQMIYYDLKKKNIELKLKDDSKTNNERQSIVKKLIEQIQSKYTRRDAAGNDYFSMPSTDQIIELVCQHFIKSYRTMNQNVITNLVETILNILNPNNFYENYKEQIKQNVYRN